MKRSDTTAADTPARLLATFIDRFEPGIATLVRQARGANLYFMYGVALPDPHRRPRRR